MLEATGLRYRAESGAPSYIAPPPRDRAAGGVTPRSALSISTVYRAVQILATSAAQLGIDVERNGVKLSTAATPSLIQRPALGMDRAEFIEQTVTSMALNGNAYWRLHSAAGMGVVHVEILTPAEVLPVQDPATGRITYHWRGEVIAAEGMKHLKLMSMAGSPAGLGPIQAAQSEIRGALDLRDYAANWFTDSMTPDAILKSDQALTKSDADSAYEMWEESAAKGRRIRVMGKGLSFEPIMLNPADAQWLENQQFTTTQIARLFGTPASLMLAAVEGSAMTYSNVEQDWIAFVRFTLMGYLRKIEIALGELVPRGQAVRFNIEALLRTDTKTRYEGHSIALGRWMTVPEVRAIENLPPLTAAELEDLKATAPVPTPSGAGAVPTEGTE